MNATTNGRDGRSRAVRRLRHLTIGTAVLGVVATGGLSVLASTTDLGTTGTAATSTTVTTADATAATTATATATTTTTTTTAAAPTVTATTASGHASTGGS